MQTDFTGSHSEQHYQPNPNSSSGIIFIILFSLALSLAYAVQHGFVVEGFIYTLSYFFDNFQVKIHNNNIIADIALLILLLLAIWGFYCALRFFMFTTITALIIAIAAAVFLAPDTDKQHTVKLKSNETVERNYAPFGG